MSKNEMYCSVPLTITQLQ